MFIADAETGIILDCNAQAEALIGRTRGQILGMHQSELHPEGEEEKYKERFALHVQQGNIGDVEVEVQHSDGRRIPVMIRDKIVEVDGKKLILGIFVDMSEHKRTEEELRGLKQQIEFILGATKTGLDIIDSEHNIRYIDSAWQSVYGDPAGKKCYEYFMGAKRVCPGCGIPKALATKKPVVTEEILVKENNRPIQVTTIPFQNEMGEWLVAEMNVDITERKRIENEIKRYRDQLEKIVETRTRELERLNEQLRGDIAARAKVEETLREREDFLASIFTSIQDGISILDKEMRIIRVNPTVERWYAHAMPLIGKKCYEAYHSRTAPCEVCPTQKTLETGSAAYEIVPLNGPGGEIVGWLDLYSYPLIDRATGKLTGVIEYMRDISDRKKAEEALRASEAKYRAVADNTYAWEFWMDPDGRLIYSSPSCERITGYAAEEFEADPGMLRTIIHPDDRARFESHEQEQDHGTSPSEMEFRVIHRGGSVRWISHVCQQIYDAADTYLGTRGSNRDITEHKVAEETLRESEEKYRALMDGAVDAILLANTDGYLLEANENALKLFGYSKKALMGTHFTHLHPEQERARVDADFKGGVESGRSFLTDGIVLRKDGKLIPVDISTCVIEYAGKKVAQGIFRDISERKRIEQMKDNLIRDVSHELKAPIAMMEMAFAMGQKALGAENIDDAQKAWSIGSRNLKTLSKDVNNILGIFSLSARRVVPQRKQISLKRMVAEIVRDLRDLIAQKKLRVKIDIPREIDKIYADRRMMRTLVHNIIDNAIKFTRHGTISLIVRSRGNEICLKVKDTGRGIAEKDMGVLFTRFFKHDPSMQGTGLGLAICKDIAGIYGGTIQVTSAGAGKGTTVTVKLPRAVLGI